ncbi:putative tape measure protein [Escherichia phage JLBYU43]|uniref:Tape measure protein n=1 Tax=Escherichia phage JLBYU43 TaxID=2894751 RepID=A0AAE8YWT7_9CAUD|nr:putative tape measure protein [Escherichia phage JLBYU43]
MTVALKVKMSNLDPRIKLAVEEIQDQIDEDFTVWSKFGNGEGCQLYSMKMGISIELNINSEGRVEAQPMFSVPGFSGFVAGIKLCLPNNHLHRVICQLVTIKHFLPEGNINDYYHEVVAAHMMKERKRRREEREKTKHQQSSTDSSN